MLRGGVARIDVCQKMPGTGLNGHPRKKPTDAFGCITLAPTASAEGVNKQRISRIERLKDTYSPDKSDSIVDGHHPITAQLPLPECSLNATGHIIQGWRWAFMQVAGNLFVVSYGEECGVILITYRPES